MIINDGYEISNDHGAILAPNNVCAVKNTRIGDERNVSVFSETPCMYRSHVYQWWDGRRPKHALDPPLRPAGPHLRSMRPAGSYARLTAAQWGPSRN